MAAARQMMERALRALVAQLSIPLGSFSPFTGVTAGHVGITSGTSHGNADDNSCQLHWGLLLKHTLRQH